MSAILDTFARARREGRAVLVGYFPAGFPTVELSKRFIAAMVEGGVDLVEVGVPYSDPLMDGPVIQAAADIALRNGATPRSVLDVVQATCARGVPAVVMSYWNPIERFGVDAFAAELAAAGGSGVITPDLTPEEAAAWTAASDAAGIDRIFLVAPSSTEDRLRVVTGATTGFVYAASTMGVTGARTSVSSAAPELVARVREVTDQPVAVGLGVSTGAQAADVADYADGVIVGSAFIARVLDAADDDAAETAVRELARELSAGVRGTR